MYEIYLKEYQWMKSLEELPLITKKLEKEECAICHGRPKMKSTLPIMEFDVAFELDQ